MRKAPEKAIVLGASGGIGSALTRALAARGVPTTGLSRSGDGCDLCDERSIAALAERHGDDADLVIVATGALAVEGRRPEKSFAEIDGDAMARAFAVNAMGPALAFKHFSPRMARHGRSVFAVLSARVGSIGDNRLGGWMSYRASKAALNQIVRCAAIEAVRGNPEAIVIALHPGTIETAMTRDFARGRFTATADDCATALLDVIEGLDQRAAGAFLAYDGTEIPW